MPDLTAARIEKTAASGAHASPGPRFARKTTSRPFATVTWPDVARVLHRESTRDAALGRYRAAGWTPDDFASKRKAREAMANALTRVEDQLELSTASRDAVRDVRRRLEWELWP